MGARVVQQLFGVGRFVVLARLLAPADFGLMGVAASALLVLHMFSGTGVRGALVQRKEDISSALNTAWTIDLARTLVIASILFAAASPISNLLNTPDATPILQALAGAFAITGLINVGTIYLRKELRVRDELSINLSAMVAESIVSVVMALVLESVWALVWGAFARSITLVAMSYVIYPYMPRLEFKKSEAGWLFRFGRWVSLNGIGVQLIHQADRLIIARILGATALGFYAISDRLSLNPVREMGQVGIRVGFPALSKLQEQKEEFARKALATIELSLSIVVPVSVASFILVDSVVPVVLGDEWVGAIDVTRMLVLAAIPMTIAQVGAVPLVAFGIPRVAAGSTLVALIALLIALPLLANRMGLEGAGLAMLIAYGSSSVVILASWRRHLGVGFSSMLRASLTPLVLAITVAPPLLAIDSSDWSNTAKTISGAATFVSIYGITSIGLWVVAKRGLMQVVLAATSRGRFATG